RDLAAWAHSWLRTVGVSTLRLSATRHPTGTYADVHVTQGSLHGMRPHRIRIGAYVALDGVTTRRDDILVDIDPQSGTSTEVTDLIGRPVADLLLPNDEDLTYAKIRLDATDLKRLAEMLPTIGNSLARALLWGAAWDLTRDAEADAGWFV